MFITVRFLAIPAVHAQNRDDSSQPDSGFDFTSVEPMHGSPLHARLIRASRVRPISWAIERNGGNSAGLN